MSKNIILKHQIEKAFLNGSKVWKTTFIRVRAQEYSIDYCLDRIDEFIFTLSI